MNDDTKKQLLIIGHKLQKLADEVEGLARIYAGAGAHRVPSAPLKGASGSHAGARGDHDGIHDRMINETPPAKKITRGPRYLALFPPEFLADANFVRWWATWEQHRRESHHILSPSTAQTQADKLIKIGPSTAATALETCVEKGWWGLDWGIKRAGQAIGPAPKATPVVSRTHHKIAVMLRKVLVDARRDPPPVDRIIATADALIEWWRALPGPITCSKPVDGPRYFLTSPSNVAKRYAEFLEQQGERFINHNALNLQQWQWKEFVLHLERQLDTDLKTGRRIHA
jgi:hypothetical protein